MTPSGPPFEGVHPVIAAMLLRAQQGGVPALSAALEAGATRIRPVLMTALAMIIGMIPMALGIGEGAEQNAPLGRAVIGGLLFATVSTLFFVPVVFAGVQSGYGNSVAISHGTVGGRDLVTFYAHQSAILVSRGQSVQRGQTIGRVGSTGNSTGPHLHFEVRLDGSTTDPLDWVSPP